MSEQENMKPGPSGLSEQRQLTPPDNQTTSPTSSQQANSVNISGNTGNNTTINVVYGDQNVNSSTVASDEKSEEAKLWEAAQELQQHQLNELEPDVILSDPKLNQAEFPQVHPNMRETDIFDDQKPLKEDFKPSTSSKVTFTLDEPPEEDKKLSTSMKVKQKLKKLKPIKFQNLFDLLMKFRFLAIVGPPGCGKTTLSKRLARSLHFPNVFVILLKFMNLGYKTELTIQQLLLDFQFRDVDKSIRDDAFKWMLKNQKKCVFVFDGYDQWNFSLKNENPLDISYDPRLSVQQLIANLCCGTFFKESKLVFTSRLHSILSIPIIFRPKLTVSVGDLPTKSVQTLFCHFAGVNGSELFKNLSTRTPLLIELCHNPLLMQFIVCASLEKGFAQVKTITDVFKVVLNKIHAFALSSKRDIHSILKGVSKMAYEGILRKSVLFTDDHLKNNDLDGVNIQDIVINVSRRQNVFEGEQSYFYFVHQMLQEMLAAVHICRFMPEADFDQIIHQVVYESHWEMVRRFVCGLLLGNGNYYKKDKAGMFREKLVMFMETNVGSYQPTDLLTDIQECSDDEKDYLVCYLPLQLDYSITISSSAAHALAEILPRLNRSVERLRLDNGNLNSDSLNLICGGIKQMRQEIKFLDLSSNQFEDDEIKFISGCLNKVKKLWLHNCIISVSGLDILREKISQLEVPMKFLELCFNEMRHKHRFIPGYKKKLMLWRCEISVHENKFTQRNIKTRICL